MRRVEAVLGLINKCFQFVIWRENVFKMVNTLIDYDKRKYEQQYIPVVTLTLE